jgi:hypothetical protein
MGRRRGFPARTGAARHLCCVQRARCGARVRRDSVRAVGDQRVRARRHALAAGSPAEGMLSAESYVCGPGDHSSTRRMRSWLQLHPSPTGLWGWRQWTMHPAVAQYVLPTKKCSVNAVEVNAAPEVSMLHKGEDCWQVVKTKRMRLCSAVGSDRVAQQGEQRSLYLKR